VITTPHQSPAESEHSLGDRRTDRRGTAYGVSPCPKQSAFPVGLVAGRCAPEARDTAVTATTSSACRPQCNTAGIFINDEDWGLQPWAAKTFEPETKDIGRKLREVCELLLRLSQLSLARDASCTKASIFIAEQTRG